MTYVRLLRPQQWIKNLFVFAGLVFGRKLGDGQAVGLTLLGFVCLCLISSAVYIINDIYDRQEDKLHPRKSKRPLASGEIGVPTAASLAAGLFVLGLGGGWLMDAGFGVVAAVYFLLQLAYTFSLKQAVILDVVSIGLGFVLRAVAGAVLVHVPISPWLVLCTFTLCLFMGFSKRRCELNALAGGRAAGRAEARGPHPAGAHRRTLRVYTPDLLNHMTTLTAGIAIVSFMLYAVDDRTKAEFGHGARELGEFVSTCLLYTLPIVVYAVFRFAVLVEHGDVDGPTDVVLRDRPFQIAILAWVLAALAIVYQPEQIKALFERITGG